MTPGVLVWPIGARLRLRPMMTTAAATPTLSQRHDAAGDPAKPPLTGPSPLLSGISTTFPTVPSSDCP